MLMPLSPSLLEINLAEAQAKSRGKGTGNSKGQSKRKGKGRGKGITATEAKAKTDATTNPIDNSKPRDAIPPTVSSWRVVQNSVPTYR